MCMTVTMLKLYSCDLYRSAVVTPNTVLSLRFVFSFRLYLLLPFRVNVSICNGTAIVPAMIPLVVVDGKHTADQVMTPKMGNMQGCVWVALGSLDEIRALDCLLSQLGNGFLPSTVLFKDAKYSSTVFVDKLLVHICWRL